ncbi:MAG: metal ABC transporter permease [Gammaproteobacteria bacterium]|jgi:zinc transport system permease protein
MDFFPALLEHEFLQRALAGGLLAVIGCGIVGSYVVVQRISLLAGAIAHAVLGGMGIAWYFGAEPIIGALVAAIIAALIIGWVKLRFAEREDTAISAIWALGMAIGILFIARTPGYSVDLMGYLFGNLLMMSSSDLRLILALDVVILGLVAVFYRQFLAVCFDAEFARVRGLQVERYYLLLLVLVALTVVMLIQVVGLILVIALMTLPAAIAGRFLNSLAGMMVLSVLLGMAFTAGGLTLSYAPDLPSGPVIILLAGLSYLVAAFLKRGTR